MQCRAARARFGCSRLPVVAAPPSSFLPWRWPMLASTLKVVAGDVTYLVDDPRADNGIKASISVVRNETTEGAPVARILHCDRINLDRAKERETFAEKAGTDPAELIEVRSRLLDLLAPVARPTDDAPEPVDPIVEA